MFDNIMDRKFNVEVEEAAPVTKEADAKLFAGLTQENVEMNRQIDIEKAERKAADNSEAASRKAADDNLEEMISQNLLYIGRLETRIAALEKKVNI